MTTYSRKLTHHATAAAATADTITMIGPDTSPPAGGAAAPPYATAGSTTGAGGVNGGRIHNSGTVDLWWSKAATAGTAADPSSTANEGVRRLPAGMTDKFTDRLPEVVLKVYAAAACDYSIEVNPA